MRGHCQSLRLVERISLLKLNNYRKLSTLAANRYLQSPIISVPNKRPRLYSQTIIGNSQSDHTTASNDYVEIKWQNKDKSTTLTKIRVGTSLLRAAQANSIDIEGACEGVCACSTCHVILESKVYDSLPHPSEEEEDMLDQAFGLTSTSRLGCQVIVTKETRRNTCEITFSY